MVMKRHLLIVCILPALILSSILASCDSANNRIISTPIFPEAVEQHIDLDMLGDAYWYAREISGIESLLVERNGVIVAEEYFTEEGVDRPHHVWSVTKSFTSALIGIAIEEGYIGSVDQVLSDYIGSVVDSLDEEKGNITIHQLLTMTCGLEWYEIGVSSIFGDWMDAPDQVDFILDLPIVDPPGTRFNYSDGAAHLLSVILTEASGMSTLDFARQYLFEPIGIESVEWAVDNRGYCLGGVGLYVTTRDMLKLGRLFLDQGYYEWNPVVPAGWVDLSTHAHVSTDDAVPFGPEYGYFWWRGFEHGQHYYFANGYSGQFIFSVPGRDLVVVATAETKDRDEAGEQWYKIIDIIVNRIIPAAY